LNCIYLILAVRFLSENARTHRTKRTITERGLFQILLAFLGGNGPQSRQGKKCDSSALLSELPII
jgi:hypothetical protein